MKISATFLLLAFVSEIASAQVIYVTGAGQRSCGKFLEQHRLSTQSADADSMTAVTQWAHGYVAGYSMNAKLPVDARPIADQATILAFLEKYCRDKPLKTVFNGIDALVRELGGETATRK